MYLVLHIYIYVTQNAYVYTICPACYVGHCSSMSDLYLGGGFGVYRLQECGVSVTGLQIKAKQIHENPKLNIVDLCKLGNSWFQGLGFFGSGL